MNILAADSITSNKLKRHLKKEHADHVGQTRDFFQRQLKILNEQQKTFTKIMSDQHRMIPLADNT